MIWKKTWFSYVLWAFYSGIMCLALALGIFMCFPSENHYIMLGTVCLFSLLLAGTYYLIQFLVKKIGTRKKISKKTAVFCEVFFMLAACISGCALRIIAILQTDMTELAQTELLQNSFLTGIAVPEAAHGQDWLFLHTLRVLFTFMGNSAMAALWLQFVLQITGSFFFYFGIRKIAGKVAAVAGFVGLMFLPLLVKTSSILNPVWMEFFLFGAGFWMTGAFLRARRNQEGTEQSSLQKIFSYLGALMLGFYLAVVLWGDLTGVLLVLLGLSVLWSLPVREKTDKRYSLRTVQALCLLLGTAGGAAALFAWKAYAYRVPFLTVVKDWWMVYCFYINKPYGIDLYGGREVVFLLLISCCFIGIFGFFKKRTEESLSGMFFFLLGIAALRMTGLFTYGVEAFDMWLLLLLTVCAAFAVGNCFRFVEVAEQTQAEEAQVTTKQPQVREEAKVMEVLEPVTEPKQEEENKPQIKFLENPLPGPKKHVPKTMDYDIEVAEDDDYDI